VDEALRSRLGAAGPAKAARFTLSQVIPRLDEVYLRVLADAKADQGQGRGRRRALAATRRSSAE
jgi:hypothetical protein